MWISLGNVDAAVSRATEAETQFLWDYLSFEDTSTAYARSQGMMGGWDGRIRLFDRRRQTFPAGLLPLLKRGAAKAGHRVEVSDTRRRPPVRAADTSWLDPVREQPQALAALLEAGRGICWAPTGSGKTEIFSALTRVVPGKWLVLVTDKGLLRQAAERIERRARMTGNPEPVGIAGDGEWAPARVTVSTVQTLHRRMEDGRAKQLLEETEGVIADEAHQVPGKQFSDVMRACPNAYWRFGFSGTPLSRGDRRNLLLVAAVGDVVYRIKASDLIDRGVLSRPRIKFLPFQHGVLPGSTWQEVYQAGVVTSGLRNALVAGVASGAPHPTLLTVKHIEHGRYLKGLLERLGVPNEFVWGNDGSDERSRAIVRLRRGDTHVLVASTIFDVGVDIPELASIVNAGGGKSAIKTLQRLGRGMRVSEGKTEIEMFDIEDRGNRWLKAHSSTRQRIYRAEGFEVTVSSASEAELASRRGSVYRPK